jgi:O-acetyl-ADP-ribose deacetylase (regulator of RNase III)
MIHYAKGDLIKSVTSGVILHQCNAYGVMGAGFALQLKNTYPDIFKTYREYCADFAIDPKRLLGESLVTKTGELTVINAFGQVGTGGRKATSYDALDKIFYNLYNGHEVPDNINMPKIGAGLGGGNWGVIEQIILSYLPADKTVTVWVL